MMAWPGRLGEDRSMVTELRRLLLIGEATLEEAQLIGEMSASFRSTRGSSVTKERCQGMSTATN